MSKRPALKWFGIIGLILIMIGSAPQAVSAILASTQYLPLVLRAEATPTITPTPTPTQTPTPTPTRTPTPTQQPLPIVNPSFEQGTTGWFFIEAYITNAWAYNGDYSAVLGNNTNNRTASIAQRFTVPYNTYNLRYYQYTQTNEICGSTFYDYIIITINNSGVQTINICRDFNGTNNWVINLVNYRGQTVDFKMTFYSDDNIASTVYVDDFAFIP